MSQLDPANKPTQPCNSSPGELDYLGLDSEARELVERCTSEIKTLTKRNSAERMSRFSMGVSLFEGYQHRES
jgi:hypothetical protein